MSERAEPSRTDVSFMMRRHDITPAGRAASEPNVLHTRLQKALLSGESRKPAEGVRVREVNYTGGCLCVCVTLTSCCPPPLPSATGAHCWEVTQTPRTLKRRVFMLF